jgi:tyrosinase
MGAYGRVESTPHNDIHVQIGGLMGNPDTAALDPIFWLHHCNIDRLWWVWDDSAHANPIDSSWTDQQFSFFNEAGAQLALRCDGVGDTVKDLDYTYERKLRFPSLLLKPEILELFRRRPPWPPWIRRIPLPVPPPPPPQDVPEPVGATDRPVRLTGDAARVRVPIDSRARRDAVGDAAPQRVVLTVDNVDAERNPGTVYGIYVNLPDDASDDELRAHHAGNISLFGIERMHQPRGDDHAHGGMRVTVDITDLVTRLSARGIWKGDDVDVTLRPIPLDVVGDTAEADAVRDEVVRNLRHDDVPITIGRVSIHME